MQEKSKPSYPSLELLTKLEWLTQYVTAEEPNEYHALEFNNLGTLASLAPYLSIPTLLNIQENKPSGDEVSYPSFATHYTQLNRIILALTDPDFRLTSIQAPETARFVDSVAAISELEIPGLGSVRIEQLGCADINQAQEYSLTKITTSEGVILISNGEVVYSNTGLEKETDQFMAAFLISQSTLNSLHVYAETIIDHQAKNSLPTEYVQLIDYLLQISLPE